MTKAKKSAPIADRLPETSGAMLGVERLARALHTMPAGERPVLEIVGVSAYAAASYTREVVPCFVFGFALILIHVAWSEWKRFVHARNPE